MNFLLKSAFPFLVFLFLANLTSAQPPMRGQNSDEAKALKIGIYTRVLELTSDEAKDFWPVFNQHEQKREELGKKEREIRLKIRVNFNDLSDTELEEMLDTLVQLKKKESELMEAYYKECKEVLPIKKVALIHQAEMLYKRELIKKIRERGPRGR